MIRFFKDQALSVQAKKNFLKWVMVPEQGGSSEAVLYLANEAFGSVIDTVLPGATELFVTNSDSFPNFGELRIGAQYIRFSARFGSRLYGIPQEGPGSIRTRIEARSVVRCVNQESSEENFRIRPVDVSDDFKVQLRNESFEWITGGNPEEFLRNHSSWTLPGTGLLCSFRGLAGDSDVVFSYDFLDYSLNEIRDVGRRRLNAEVVGEISRVPVTGDSLKGSFPHFLGSHLRIAGLAPVFPAAGSIEMWFSGTPEGATLFSVTDDITEAEKFSIRLWNDRKIRVFMTDGSGIVRSYSGRVPVSREHWHQVVVSWSGSRLRIFVDGGIDVDTQQLAPVQTGTGYCYIGKSATVPFRGLIGKLRMWSSEVGPDQVATMWNDGQGWSANDHEPILRFRVKVSSGAGQPVRSGFSLVGSEITGYDHDPAAPVALMAASRRNQGVRSQMRILPPERRIPDTLPAFRYGEYRWRENEEASREVLPANWNIPEEVLEDKKWVSGICHGSDLAPVRLIKIPELNEIHPVILGGEYFIGRERGYLPAQPVLDIFNATSTAREFTLSKKPAPTKPVFAGRWRSDRVDKYVRDISYRYVGKSFSSESSFDPQDPGFQFRYDAKLNKVFVNTALQNEEGLLGIFPSYTNRFTFRLPVHPVFAINRVYRRTDDAFTDVRSYTFDQRAGTVTVEVAPDQISSWASKLIFINYVPGLGVFYDTAASGTERVLHEVELNPAFAGLADGYVCLRQKIRQPKALMLQVDKPRVPYTVQAERPEDIEFGPVYQEDYAVLTVTAFGSNEEELISGARLLVSPVQDGWEGAINYKDPVKETFHVTTGADGSASLVYTPGTSYGYYLQPAASITGAKITLPAPVLLDRVYDRFTERMSARLYAVINDDPYFGKVGADSDIGEIAWQTWGTPGQTSYKTNGRRLMWKLPDGAPVLPTDLRDENDVSWKDPRFTGQVKYIIYPDALATGGRIGAYFIAFTGRVTIYVVSPEYNVTSNPITLRVVPPDQITDISYVDDSLFAPIAGYLMLNDFAEDTGELNKNRLTGGPLLELRFRKRL